MNKKAQQKQSQKHLTVSVQQKLLGILDYLQGVSEKYPISKCSILFYLYFIINIFYLRQCLSKGLFSVIEILNVFQDTLYFIHWSLVWSQVFKIQEGEV